MRTSHSYSPTLTRGYTIAFIAAGILSTTAIFIHYLTQTYHVPALVLAFWRDLFVVGTLLPVLAVVGPERLHVERRHWPYFALYGLVLALFNALWTLSVALNGAAVSTVLVYSSAAFTVLLGWWLLKESLGWVKVMAVVLSLTGCALVSGVYDVSAWNTNWLGILCGVLAGLAYAGYSLMGRSASQRGLSPWTTLLYTFAFAAVYLLLMNLIPGGILPGAAAQPSDLMWLKDAWAGWLVLFVLAAVPTVLGYGLYNVSLKHLPSSIANLIATSEPVFTAITAYFVLNERLNLLQIGGGLLVLGGVVFLRLFEGHTRNRQEVIGDSI
ncbi:MAG TPA: EamA family transporter [Anaerolineae bacterium]|jgi:drug/metabolite transporter (DMT)-like permease